MAKIIAINSVIALLFVETKLLRSVTGQSDVTLTCPTNWCSGERVTLYCVVAKSSIKNKCVSHFDITHFRLKGNNGSYVTQCTVGSQGYSNCNYLLNLPKRFDCGCQQNETYYTFVYEINATSTLHNGDWDCEKMCHDSDGSTNPLTVTVSPNCQNIAVTACKVEPEKPVSTVKTVTTVNPSSESENAGNLAEPTDETTINITIAVGVLAAVTLISVFVIACRKAQAGAQNQTPNDDPHPENQPDPVDHIHPKDHPHLENHPRPEDDPNPEDDVESSTTGSDISEDSEYGSEIN